VQLTGVFTSDTGVLDRAIDASVEFTEAVENSLSTVKYLKNEPLVRKKVGFFVNSEEYADDSPMRKVKRETILAFHTPATF
jgi:hypothetical protein